VQSILRKDYIFLWSKWYFWCSFERFLAYGALLDLYMRFYAVLAPFRCFLAIFREFKQFLVDFVCFST
jgi:hypothetical protein